MELFYVGVIFQDSLVLFWLIENFDAWKRTRQCCKTASLSRFQGLKSFEMKLAYEMRMTKKKELKLQSNLGGRRCFWKMKQLSWRPHPPSMKWLVSVQNKKKWKRKLSLWIIKSHLRWCDATSFQGICTTGAAAAGDDSRVRVDGEHGGAWRGGALHHQGCCRQVERDWRHKVTDHLR